MKKIFISSIFTALILSATSTFALVNKSEHFTVYFNSGDVYEATLKGSTLSWKGIAGVDAGEVRENQVKNLETSKNVEVFQWTERKTGSFVTLILDRKHHKAICSGKMVDNSNWFWLGKVYS